MPLTRPLDAATATWNDYVGTAAADDADATLGSRSLYDLTGLDRNRWVIVGVDLQVRGAGPEVTVYAVDSATARSGDEPFDIDTLVAEHGHVPVTAFRLGSDTQIEDFLNDAFRRVSVRLVARGFRDEQLVVHGSGTVVAAGF